MTPERMKELLASRGRSLEPGAVSHSEVLRDELSAIGCRRRALEIEPEIPKREEYDPDDAFDAGLFGLALSGGGIRSATFNLGVLQVLARYGLLRYIDYLSTVSGGGYIGGWFTALIQRSFSGENAKPFGKTEFQSLEKELAWSAGDGGAAGFDREHWAIRFLRRFSNFLTPKLGVFSADTWALFAIYLRNVALNQLVLAFALIVCLLGPRLLSYLLRVLEDLVWGWPGRITAALLIACALWTLGTNLGSVAGGNDERRSVGTAEIVIRLILPVLGLGILGCVLLPRFVAGSGGGWPWAIGLGAVINGLVWALAAFFAYLSSPKGDASSGASFSSAYSRRFWLWAIVTAIPAGAVLGPLLLWLAALLDGASYMGYRVAFVPPAFVAALLVAAMVHIGLAGNGFGGRHREWLSRLGGLLAIAALAWAAGSALVFLSPWASALPSYIDRPLLGAWVATTLSGIYVGRTTSSEGVAPFVKRVVMMVAPWVFIGGLLIMLAWSAQALLGLVATAMSDLFSADVVRAVEENAGVAQGIANLRAVNWGEYGDWLAATEHLQLLLAVGVPASLLAAIFSHRVDINSFSLHNMYANRIIRCFLGATVPNRSEDAFTRFSTRDDLTLCAVVPRRNGNEPGDDAGSSNKLAAFEHLESWRPVPDRETGRPNGHCAYPGPYHLVCTAINLAGGDNLAWQERKAGSFVLAPLYCGFELASDGDHKGPAYRPTQQFSARPGALTLGEAMATSGAAASPNMGYHTTSALALLMAVFNIRLGRWVANPRPRNRWDRAWLKNGPRFALWHLLKEVFGMTDEKSSFVYLSDGGHFENLGIYELVRRRCRYVIACDSGADPEYLFEDLGNAIRKCRIDLGVEIDLDVEQIARRDEDGFNDTPCAVGKIRYADDRIGTLLYIKSSRREGAPSDVVQYARRQTAFPHESTADQFFSESQFESYRRLGRFLATEVFRGAVADARHDEDSPTYLWRLFRALEENWYGSSTAVSTHFSTLTTQIDNLFERLRTSDELNFLNEQFYPEWQTLLSEDTTVPAYHRHDMWDLPADETSLKHGFYFCNSLIQLMENVYLYLDLDSEWMHPDNSGWMNVFRHWAWSSMFRITWAISAATYGRRFRAFCRQQLKLELGWLDLVEIPLDASRAIEQCVEAGRLNHVECEQVARLAEKRKRENLRVFRLDLKVPYMAGAERNPSSALLRSFGVGYALLDGNELVMYRVQDHLRNMGLGQRGLKELVDRVRGAGRIVVSGNVEDALRTISETVDGKWIAEFRASLASLQPRDPVTAGRA